MFGRKKDRTAPAGRGSAIRVVPSMEEGFRLMRAFLVEPAPGMAPPGMAPPGMAPPGMAPPLAAPPLAAPPLAAPPLAAPPFAAGVSPVGGPSRPFVFNISPLIGAEGAIGNAPPGATAAMQIPGLGPVTPQQMHQAGERIQQVITQLSDGADLDKGVTPAQLATASERLEAMHAQANLTEEQYQALKAVLDRTRAAS